MNIVSTVKSLLFKKLDIGEDPSRPVQCLISTRDMHVDRIELPARSWYITNEEDKQAYYLDTAGAFRIRETGEYEFVLDEINAFPWYVAYTDGNKIDKIIGQLNALTDSEGLRQREISKKNSGKDYQSRVILAILSGVALVIIILCLLFAVPGLLDKWGFEISWF